VCWIVVKFVTLKPPEVCFVGCSALGEVCSDVSVMDDIGPQVSVAFAYRQGFAERV
jgi:hypothetical protein